jgi:hypothetical protein
MGASFDFFNAVRVQAIMQGVYDPRLNPQPLIWDKRIPSVDAFDDEIIARFIGFPMTADLIADDAQAVTYSMGKFQYETTRIPKLKLGIGLNENQLRQLNRLQQNAATRDEVGVFQNWENRIVSAARYGVDMRREALLISMLFDGLSYDRLGIKLSGVSWGMPSDLKVTVGTTWDQTTATPVADTLLVKLIAKIRYGMNYNRMTMSTTAFRNMINTTEFQNKARMYLAPNVSFVNLNISDIGSMQRLATNVLEGMTIELDDRRMWIQGSDGSVNSAPLWPTAGVALTDSNMDGNTMAWNFANTELMEKIVSNLAGGLPQVAALRGPTVYPTLSNPQLNAPGATYWAVQRGFPRKPLLPVNAALTVGTFTDSVSTALPF